MYPHLVGKDYQAVEHNHRVSFILHPFSPDNHQACMKTVFDLVWSHELRDLKWIFDAVLKAFRGFIFQDNGWNSLLGASLLILRCCFILWQELFPFFSQGWWREFLETDWKETPLKKRFRSMFAKTKHTQSDDTHCLQCHSFLSKKCINANPDFNAFYGLPRNTLLSFVTWKSSQTSEKINLQVFKFYAKLPILPDPMVICQPFDCLFLAQESWVRLLVSMASENRSFSSFLCSEFLINSWPPWTGLEADNVPVDIAEVPEMNCCTHFPHFPSEGNIDVNKSSITNGICCSTNTKFTKAARKNSNLSQQDIDKKPLNNNNSGGRSKNNEHFDGIDEIISAVNTATLKPKKSNQNKSKDRKKIHGSLPNHLDTDVDYEGSDDTNSSGKWIFTILASVSVSCLYRSLTRIVN